MATNTNGRDATSGRGGFREGSGRKAMFGGPMAKSSITVPTRTIKTAKRLGADGNVSDGLRRACEVVDLLAAGDVDGAKALLAGFTKPKRARASG